MQAGSFVNPTICNDVSIKSVHWHGIISVLGVCAALDCAYRLGASGHHIEEIQRQNSCRSPPLAADVFGGCRLKLLYRFVCVPEVPLASWPQVHKVLFPHFGHCVEHVGPQS